MRKEQLFLRPGDGHIKQAAFFFQVHFFAAATANGEEFLFQAHHKHDRKFQPFRRMDAHERHFRGVVFHLVDVAHQRHFLQKSGQRRRFRRPFVIGDVVQQFHHVLTPIQRFFRVLFDELLHIPGLLEQSACGFDDGGGLDLLLRLDNRPFEFGDADLRGLVDFT